MRENWLREKQEKKNSEIRKEVEGKDEKNCLKERNKRREPVKYGRKGKGKGKIRGE